jgi:hypothetical protein
MRALIKRIKRETPGVGRLRKMNGDGSGIRKLRMTDKTSREKKKRRDKKWKSRNNYNLKRRRGSKKRKKLEKE